MSDEGEYLDLLESVNDEEQFLDGLKEIEGIRTAGFKDTWYFYKDGVKYWEWRHAYSKLLSYIAELREPLERLHKDSDKQMVRILQKCRNKCQLWIEEMKNPEKA